MAKALTQDIRIVLVDGHAMFREGLARTLKDEPDFTVAAECATAAEAIPQLKNGVTIALVDVDLGAERGLEFVEAARRAGYQGRILVVTAGISGQEAVQLIQGGVAGIIHKHHSSAELCIAIRLVTRGEQWLEPDYLSPLFRSVDRTRLSNRPKLTERDRTVLRAILQGLSNKDIAGRLSISEGAVKASIRLLFEKMGARTRAQLVRIALEDYKNEL